MALYTPRRRRKPDINIVPLVDVLVVLIFFFLLTMQAKDTKSLDITPPKMDTAGQASPAQRFIISVDKAGEYFINNEKLTAEQLTAALQTAAKTQGTDLNILIFADQDTPLKNVTYVMDEGRKLNFDKIRLQAR